MTRTFLFLSMLIFALGLKAQDEAASAYLQVNNIKALFRSNGSLFWDGEQGQFLVGDQGAISPIRAGGLWLSGTDPGGNLKGAIQLYNEEGRQDFKPYDWDPGEEKFDKIFKVTGDQIRAHLADFADNNVIDNPIPEIFQWPGKDNSFFADYFGFNPAYSAVNAPFYDQDGDAVYDPSRGDFPIIQVRGCNNATFADEMLYFVYDDYISHSQSGMDPMAMEVHALAYSFNCSENELLNNTVFVNYRLINLGSEDLEDTHLGLYLDFALGCSQNDYIGTNRDYAAVFAYNSTATDPDCGVEQGYDNLPPVVSAMMLRGPLNESGDELSLSNTMPLYRDNADLPAGMGFPETAIEYDHYLSGRWRDGSPLTFGGNGYQGTDPTSYVFPDNPADATGWSEDAVFSPTGPRSMLLSSGPFLLQPGAVNEFLFAFSFHQNSGADNLENVEAMYDSVAQLRNLFDNCFEVGNSSITCTQSLTAVREAGQLNQYFNCYPNPASENLTIEISGIKAERLRVINALGQVVHLLNQPETITSLDVQNFASGLYFIEIISGKKSGVKKVLLE